MSPNIKDTNKDTRGDKNLSVQSNFHIGHIAQSNHHAFIVRKTEKLASALYVITGFLPAEEPLRTRLRTCALDLITRATDPQGLQGAGVESFGARCLEIGTILETAQSGGLVSPMNARLISEEYLSLASFVRENEINLSHRSERAREGIVEESFYDPKGQNKDSRNKASFKRTNNTIKDKDSKGQSDRKSMILKIFNKKDKVSIKDVSSVIQNCSEKTLQRELLALVRDGILMKEGERRWSTYRKIAA